MRLAILSVWGVISLIGPVDTVFGAINAIQLERSGPHPVNAVQKQDSIEAKNDIDEGQEVARRLKRILIAEGVGGVSAVEQAFRMSEKDWQSGGREMYNEHVGYPLSKGLGGLLPIYTLTYSKPEGRPALIFSAFQYPWQARPFIGFSDACRELNMVVDIPKPSLSSHNLGSHYARSKDKQFGKLVVTIMGAGAPALVVFISIEELEL